jgi:hypothetical protein
MSRIVVQEDPRKSKRDLRKVFNYDFFKIITEIILNADDSYRRLEDSHQINSKQTIKIMFDRDERILTIIDNAEGMSYDDMKRIFSNYGGDHSKYQNHQGVRGLFGQGAGDVLYNAAFSKKIAQIISFKDNQVTKCKFYYRDKKEIEVDVISKNIDLLRKKYQMKENGTIVEFGLDKKIIVPSKNQIKEKIESFYMLRFVLSNPKRDVLFSEGGISYELSSNAYTTNGLESLVTDKNIKFTYDDEIIHGKLSLFKDNSKLAQRKIIIIDENQVVYDETYFDYDKSLGIQLLTGVLELPKISQIIRKHLNADDPKELLTDTRDGFDRRNTFTKSMYDAVGKTIEQTLKKINQERDSQPIDLSTNKTFQDIMKKLNSYYRELELSSIGGLAAGKEPPAEGLQFARNTISITKGKTYGLLLYINPKQISTDDEIKIECEDDYHINLQTKIITYTEEDIKDSIVRKQVVIQGRNINHSPIIIKASTKDYETKVMIQVIDEKIIYPDNGMEFIPKRKTIIPNRNALLKLYIDTDYIPIGSEIVIEEKETGSLFNTQKTIKFNKEDLITESIGKIDLEVEGKSFMGEIYIEASYKDIQAKATMYIREKEKENEGYDGLLNKIQLKYEKDEAWQAQLDHHSGILYINGSHIINVKNMGNLNFSDIKNPQFSTQKQYYLFELIAEETSKRIVLQQYEKEPQDKKEILVEKIQYQKTRIYEMLYEILSK